MITFLDLYNKVSGQAWSMFDGEVESAEEFETSVTSSIQKALGNLWCSHKFSFTQKTMSFKTTIGCSNYLSPNGNIIKKNVKGQMVYAIRCEDNYLEYDEFCDEDNTEFGKPSHFCIKNDEIVLSPIPDKEYDISIEYNSIFCAKSKDGLEKAVLEEEDDYIDIPVKYERLFLNALLPYAMTYAIANETDENYSAYHKQYLAALELLLDKTEVVQVKRKYGWK